MDMKRQLIHKLTASMMIAAGILICDTETIFAQNQSQPNSSSKQTDNHAGHGAKSGSANKGKSMKNTSEQAMFVKKASESNLAEIQLSELAMKKSSDEKIKEYAQMMIKHHTTAQTELASLASNYSGANANASQMGSSVSGTTGTDGQMAKSNSNDQSNSNQGTQSGTDKPNASGSTTATGSTYSSGNANGAIGTTGNTAGRSADGAASNNTAGTGSDNGNASNNADANATSNPSMSPSRVGRGQTSEPGNVTEGSSDANDESDGTGGGGPGANSGGTTSSMSNSRVSRTTTDTQKGNEGSDAGSAMGNDVNTVTSTMEFDLPTELSAEHKAIREKLVKLSGAEFDKEYMQVMLKDHAKSVELFEKQSYKTDNEQLSTFAAKTLPIIKEHYEMAKKMTGSSGTNKASSGK